LISQLLGRIRLVSHADKVADPSAQLREGSTGPDQGGIYGALLLRQFPKIRLAWIHHRSVCRDARRLAQ
jgi:hypothetical protein